MPGLVPGIHVFLSRLKTWMAGTSPAMTNDFNGSQRGATDERPLQTDRRTRNRIRAPPYRPLAARRRYHAGDRRRKEPRPADERDAARRDPAGRAARSRAALERNRGA